MEVTIAYSSHKIESENLLLTGKPGIGKTTICLNVVESLERAVRGFTTEEIRERGKRIGFRIRTLSGQERVLSHVDIDGPSVSRYGVDVAAMEDVVCPELERALEEDEPPLLIVDEIGKMELKSERFRQLIPVILESGAEVLATVPTRGPAFVEELKNRDDTRVRKVTEQNRDELPDRILARLTIAGNPGQDC